MHKVAQRLPNLSTTALLGAALSLACASDSNEVGSHYAGTDSGVSTSGAETDATDTNASSSTAGDGDSATTDATESTGSTDTNATTGPLLDIGGTGGSAEAGMDGCDKVDFLFVIDNSISMGDEQNNLSNSFPEFIQTIQSQVVGDYHVMVVDTDPEDKWDEELTECIEDDCVGEPPDEMCGILAPENMWPCGSLPELDECDPSFGAGVDYSGTDNRMPCGIDNGQRWFDEAQTNQQQVFECIANLYDGNNPERTMDAVTTALSPALVGPGGCNEGFLRDDAVLVVTFISDEEDDEESSGNPTVWHDTLLALKQQNETAIVVLGLLGDTGLPGAVCPPDSVPGSNGGEYSPRLIEYVESWGTRGLWGSVCEPNYASFFDQAVGLIDMACDEFVPVD